MKIAVVGMGYVGMSMGALLALGHEVVAVDIVPERVDLINARRSPIVEAEMDERLALPELKLRATLDLSEAVADADFVVISTPTDYDPELDFFDTSSVESVIAQVGQLAPQVSIVVKSTVPVGFTERMREQHPGMTILFSPEFLREGRALHDNLYPSRIIVGPHNPQAETFAGMLKHASLNADVEVLLTGSTEAEAIKLFANTYLAMRVAYFNEVDTFAATRGLNTRDIVTGIGLDARIGSHYNNPSFGYGGYCLPKDTKQLLANYHDVPQTLIQAIVESNVTRMDFVTHDILRRNPHVVGIYRLAMKAGSDNFRSSAILEILKRIRAEGIEVILFEPLLADDEYLHTEVVRDLEEFKRRSDLIATNRQADELADVASKLYTRDLFGSD